jgi:hypothetical protein
MRWVVAIALVACTGGSTSTGKPSGDTGVPPSLRCPADVTSLFARVCASTDAALAPPTGYGGYGDFEITGEVSEVGGVLARVGDAVPGFAPCGSTDLQQVRVTNDLGETWTVGWDIEGPVDDASADAVLVGAPVTLHLVSGYGGYVLVNGFVLSDEVGPLVLFEENGPELTDAERDDVGVDVDTSDRCLVQTSYGRVEHYLVTFGGPSGSLSLRSGQSGTVDGSNRALSMSLASSDWALGCADGCGSTVWAGWEEP